ncbi:MAG: GxxExxY protein [Candidatus Kuenenbacteria bacterium]
MLMKSDLIYPELSYQLTGITFKVFNNLGYGFQEKYYQRAIAYELKENKLFFKQEVFIPIKYNNKIIGRYFIDFVIENKIAIELKVGKEFYPKDWKQLAAYLKITKLPLGILILITKDGIKFRRIANTKTNLLV